MNSIVQLIAREQPVTAPQSRTFIRATEVWTLDEASQRLTLASGIYGDMTRFAEVSRGQSFGYDEGLPGRAWASGCTVVLNGFGGSYFKRIEAAAAEGLGTGVAIPVFRARKLKGVVVFLCGQDAEHIGAIEVWRATYHPGDTMSLADGYYGSAQHFEWISRRTQFPMGQGLPGRVWESGQPCLIRDLGNSHRFIRSDDAGDAGMTMGLGIPVSTNVPGAEVLALLSARGTPIARRFEIWTHAGGGRLQFADGMCEAEGAPHREAAQGFIEPGEGHIGAVAATGIPAAVTDLEAGSSACERAALRHGFRSIVALPVFGPEGLRNVAAWYF
ncbi:MAG: GAF domain-containing protein [Minwuia sp.]|uniref:GAF domain-containing protein n=1 Tax=Minwuia sp. TaxID=2493630 RepID=UPI003A84A71D